MTLLSWIRSNNYGKGTATPELATARQTTQSEGRCVAVPEPELAAAPHKPSPRGGPDVALSVMRAVTSTLFMNIFEKPQKLIVIVRQRPAQRTFTHTLQGEVRGLADVACVVHQ